LPGRCDCLKAKTPAHLLIVSVSPGIVDWIKERYVTWEKHICVGPKWWDGFHQLGGWVVVPHSSVRLFFLLHSSSPTSYSRCYLLTTDPNFSTLRGCSLVRTMRRLRPFFDLVRIGSKGSKCSKRLILAGLHRNDRHCFCQQRLLSLDIFAISCLAVNIHKEVTTCCRMLSQGLDFIAYQKGWSGIRRANAKTICSLLFHNKDRRLRRKDTRTPMVGSNS